MADYRRGYSWETIDYIPAPTGGWNPDSVPWELPNDQAPVLDNFLIRPGNIQARGAFSAIADIGSHGGGSIGAIPAGALVIPNMSLVGVLPWDAPVLAGVSGSNTQAGTTITWVDSLGNIETSTVSGRHLVPGPRWINFDGTLYGVGFDSEIATLRDKSDSYYIPATQLLTLPFVSGQTVFSQTQNSAFDSSAAPPDGSTATAWTAAPPNEADVRGPFSTTGESASLVVAASAFSLPTSATVYAADVVMDILIQVPKYLGNPAGLGSDVNWKYRWATTKSGLSSASYSAAGTQALTALSTGPTTFTTSFAPSLAPTTAQLNAGIWIEFYMTTNTTAGCTGPVPNLNNTIVTLVDAVVGADAFEAFTTSTPTALSAAPQGAVDIAGYLGRIWLAQGCDTPGGSGVSGTYTPSVIHSPTTLYFTNFIVAGGGGTDTDWIDPSTFLTNTITLDQDSSDPITGLSALRTGLVIFRRNSVYVLKGTTTANFQVVQLSDETGCLDPRSIVETDSGIYFVGQKGLMLTDGTKVSNVSGNITYTLQQAVNAEQWNIINPGSSGYITCGLTTQGQILLSIGALPVGGDLKPIFAAMYDPTYQAWTRITSHLWDVDNDRSQSTFGYPGLIVSDRISALRSVHSVGSKYVVMLEDQQLAYSFLNQSSLYDTDTTGASHAIPLVWKTRYAPIIGTTTLMRKWGQAKRYVLDHTFAVGGGSIAPGTSPGWVVTPVNAADSQWSPADSNVLTSSIVSSTSGGPITAGYGVQPSVLIQRENIDFTAEVDDLGFDITYADTSTSNTATGVIASIYGIGVEYQPARDRR